MNPYATHWSHLERVIRSSTGSVLECGVGYFSTPLLHVLCHPKRPLLSADHSADWLHQFAPLQNEYHSMLLVEDWLQAGKLLAPWRVVFIDQWPEESRAPLINRLRRKTSIFVIHDAEINQEIKDTIRSFSSRFVSLEYPKTAIVSDFLPVDSLACPP